MQNIRIENSNINTIGRGREYWRELITAWEQSNEHPRDFCARMNIRMGTFAHWRGIFSKEAKPKPNRFIEMQVKQPLKILSPSVTIECPSGHKIVFPAGLNQEEMKEIVSMLGLIA